MSSFAFYTKFIFDSQLKKWLESQLSQLHGAKVNIQSLETHFFKGNLVLKEIQFGSPTTPMRNTFQINTVTTHFSVGPLLRKKLHISELSLDGFQYWTQREEPSINPDSFDTTIVAAALMDRASSGIYTGIKNELTDNPLRHLGQLGMGFTLQSRIALLADKLTTIRELKTLLQELKEKEPFWERRKSEIPSEATLAGLQGRIQKEKSRSESESLEELRSKTEYLQSLLQDINQQIQKTETGLQRARDVMEEDVALIRRELGLPDNTHEDLTNLIFGPTWLGYLEKLSYWIEFGRGQSPVGSLTDTYGMTVLNRNGKRSVHFGKLGALPSFLLEQAIFKSGYRQNSSKVKIDGVLKGLTSDPVLLGKPTTLQLSVDYPEEGLRHVTIDATMDHTGVIPKEVLALSIASFPIEDWALTRTSDVQLKIKNALVGLNLTGHFEGDQIDLKWDINLSETEYQVQSRFRQVEQTLKTMVEDLYAFSLNGSITGDKQAISFVSKSGLGSRLASGLRTEFKHEFSALNQAIISETQSLLPPLKDQILTLLQKNKEEIRPALEKSLNQLRAIEKSASNLS